MDSPDPKNRSTGPRPPKRKRRRRRGPKPPGAPAKVLAEVSARPVETKPADVPLTQEEAAQMRAHFQVLKEYRKELRLRLNATEDLLLNGAREPTHRGVCQHLLSKIDRARVVSAAQRLDPLSATRLVEGILRISPDIEYVLLYLECVQRSASPAVAIAALARGLTRIDFAQVSHAQMRRVLDLIVELFDEKQRPELLFGLLEGKTFRAAFDESANSFPEPLSQLVVPLRAVQSAVLHGKSRPHDPEMLRRGVALVLGASDKTLLHYSPTVRRRLLTLGMQAGREVGDAGRHGLAVLYGSVDHADPGHLDLGLSLVRHLLETDAEGDAKRVLKNLVRDHADAELPARWREALDGPRVGPVALLRPKRSDDEPAQQRRRKSAGLLLPTLRPVWVFLGEPDGAAAHEQTAALVRQLCVANVTPWLHSGTTEAGEPFWVAPRPGQSLEPALDRRSGVDLQTALCVCRDGVAALAGLAAQGVRLPDARLRRFDLTAEDRLWLVDLTGATAAAPDEASPAHAKLARALCQAVWSRARRYVPPPDLVAAVDAGASMAEVVGCVERHLET